MVSRRTDRLLNKITHHTNIYQPFTKYISGEKYPLQDGDKLGTLVKLKYRNKYISDINHISPNPNEYQYPDEFEFTPTPYKDGIFVGDIIEQDFILLRCDLTEPYFMIAMSDDYVAMIVGDSRNYMDIVHKYPKQIDKDTVDDDYKFEASMDVLEIMPFGIAADLLKSDVSAQYGRIYQEAYNNALNMLDIRVADGQIEFVGGING